MEYLKKRNKLHLIALTFLTILISACSTLDSRKIRVSTFLSILSFMLINIDGFERGM